jgi:hypothetical protein
MCPAASAFGLEIRGSDNTLIKSIGPGDTISLYAKSAAPVGASSWQTLSAVSQTSVSAVNAIALASQSSATGWLSTNATAVTYTGTSNPLNGITPSAIQMDSSTAGGFNKYRFSLPDGLKNRPLNIDFHAKTTAAGDYRVEIYTNTAADYSGSFTKVALSSDNSSGNSDLPAGNSNFRTFFVAQTADYYELRIVRVAGTAATAFVTQVSLGMLGLLGNGAVVTDPQSITFAVPTGLGAGSATNTATFSRTGKHMFVNLRCLKDATPGSGATAVIFTMPTGYTINLTDLPASNHIGVGALDITSAFGVESAAAAASSTTFILRKNGTAANITGADMTANSELNFQLKIPISEWSSNVQMADRAVEEYAWNTDTTNVTATTGFGNGAGGVLFPNRTVGTEITKRIQFQTPIQATDILTLEVLQSGGSWTPYNFRLPNNAEQNGQPYGMVLVPVTTTQMDVVFRAGGTAPGATFGSTIAGNGFDGLFSIGFKWRVRKVSSGAQIGGAISTGNIVTRSDGSLPGSGYVGYTISSITRSSATGVITSSTYFDLTSLVLTKGIWLVKGFFLFRRNSATLTTFDAGVGLGTSSGTGGPASDYFTEINTGTNVSGMGDGSQLITAIIRSDGSNLFQEDGNQLGTGTTLYLKGFYGTFTGSPQRQYALTATCIA